MTDADLLPLVPDWPAPASVQARITTRAGGYSRVPYDSNNLGLHVGDDPVPVGKNRAALTLDCDLEAIQWLRQVHGTDVCEARPGEGEQTADGCFTRATGLACSVLTADCLPVLVCDRRGTQVAALHAGWRGLAGGIIASGLATFDTAPAGLMAYLGPAIGPAHFEVGGEVREAFMAAARNPAQRRAAAAAFTPARARRGHYFADLYALARAELTALGVGEVYGGGDCTFAQSQRFYSYRRDGITGRMASLVWLSADCS
ncbi:peptidoglycan editing factor PgeF [Exilibacterium tricleocarpae]|uniref:Purine nucleoside phosphorylase n=1 Tax=Exilibacterium tricleocarpae TaxID=2591008 RepID=A0A545T1X6_9GAMM|nr:peptidoglycan editing factor PgeF [Exilibacterium tricleocarpae]TQV71206.1 peptidoglycan editing factor PgeF [Exilibacterium tricleocarpae]